MNFCIPASYLRPLIANQKSLISFGSALSDYTSDGKKDKLTGVNKSNKSDAGSSAAAEAGAAPRRNSPTMTSDDVGVHRDDVIPVASGATTRLTIIKSRDGAARPEKYVYTMDDGIFASMAVSRLFPPSPISRGTYHAPDDVTIKFRGQNINITLEFATFGIGDVIAVGHYDRCQRASSSEGTPGLDVSMWNVQASSGCGQLTGEFDVYDAQFDTVKGQPRLVSFAASFEERCSGQALKGTIYFNSAPIPGLD